MNSDIHTEFRLFLDKKLPDIHRKLDRAEKLTLECNPHMINIMSDIDILLEQNKKFKGAREYTVVNQDTIDIKADFINNCDCKRTKQT